MDPHAAYLEMFKNAKTKNVDFEIACNYAFYRKQYGRWYQKRFDYCSMKNIAEKYQTLFGENTRWLDFNDDDLAFFATDESFKMLAKCKILVADATFATSPEGTHQVFVIHGLVENDQGGEWVALCLAIMKDKKESNYQKVMERIRDAWVRLGVTPQISFFSRHQVDFEPWVY
jgi:hypothetical protein